MPISLECPVCLVRIKAPTKLAGQTLACPLCKTPVRIPSLHPIAEPEDSLRIRAMAEQLDVLEEVDPASEPLDVLEEVEEEVDSLEEVEKPGPRVIEKP